MINEIIKKITPYIEKSYNEIIKQFEIEKGDER